MNKLRFYSVSDQYISFLRSDPRLHNVVDNKEGRRVHTRKYLGIVLQQGGFNYFVPVSSPKATDYYVRPDGSRAIRRSVVPIIRLTSRETKSGEPELKGTLKLSNMIPVPASELTPYSIPDEPDYDYSRIILKEYNFIVKNRSLIVKNAAVLYNQKTRAGELFSDGNAPNYLASVVDFTYAEQKCLEFIHSKNLADKAPQERPSVRDRLAQLRQAAKDNPKIIERNDRDPR